MTESAATQEMGLFHRYTAALKYGDYRRFWVSASFAGAGVWGLIAARGVLAFDISNESSFWVGVTTFAALIPFVVVPPFSGVLADKFDRRNLIAAAHAINVLLALLLVALYFTDTILLWHLPVVSLLSGIARGVQMPTQNALVPNLVSKDDLLNAISLNNISLQGSRLVGGLSVLMLGWLSEASIGIAFAVAAFGYAVATIMVVDHPDGLLGPNRSRGLHRHRLYGGNRLRVEDADRRPDAHLRRFSTAASPWALSRSFPSTARNNGRRIRRWPRSWHRSASGAVFGVLIVAGIRSQRTKGIALLASAAGSSVGVLVLGFAPSLSTGLAGAFIMGLTQAPFMSLSITYIQSVVPDAIRGRVSSLFAMSALSLMAILNMVFGLIADIVGSVPVLIVSGTVFIVVVLVVMAVVTKLRRVMIEGFDIGAPTQAPAPAPSGASS